MTVYALRVEEHSDIYILETLYEDRDEAIYYALDFANSQLRSGEVIQRYGESGELILAIGADGYTRFTIKPYSMFLKLK